MENELVCKVVMLQKTGNQMGERNHSLCMLHNNIPNHPLDFYKSPSKLVHAIGDASEPYSMTAKTRCSNTAVYWNGILEPLHLYLVSDREIKEGDWYMNTLAGRLHKSNDAGPPPNDGYFKKVEATTDKSLGLPLIPQSFIEEFVQKQGKIDKVKIAYAYDAGGKDDHGPLLQLTGWAKHLVEEAGEPIELHKDSVEVIILPIKDSWNKEDMKKAYEDGIKEGIHYNKLSEWETQGWTFNEWFDKNY